MAGGHFMIYNVSPARNLPDRPWIPRAGGRFPFKRKPLAGAGFRIRVCDEDDTVTAPEAGRRLGGDREGMDIDKDLSGRVTLVQGPSTPPAGSGS